MAKKRRASREDNTARALEVGRVMARQSIKRRREVARRRHHALAANKALRAAGATSAGVLVAEGDSWFDHPSFDILNELEEKYAYDVDWVSNAGDTIEDMAYSGGQLDELTRLLQKLLRRDGTPPKAILLSGGGNDVIGDEFAVLLNHASSGIAGINEKVATGLIEERVQDAYLTILSAITEVCTVEIGKPLPIIVHGYDYPVPDGRGFWGVLKGPWLEPGFLRKGYEQMAGRKPIIEKLINRFNEMLERMPKHFAHVHYVNLRGTLPTGSNYKDWWANETHPTKKGFQEVTKKFAKKLDEF